MQQGKKSQLHFLSFSSLSCKIATELCVQSNNRTLHALQIVFCLWLSVSHYLDIQMAVSHC